MKLNFTKLCGALLLGCALGSIESEAQLVSGDAFLNGKYVEIGVAPNGAFGSQFGAPTGYHGRALSSPTSAVGFVADPDKDGWTVGSPAMCGDYFLPGVKQEGWDIEVAGSHSIAWRNSGVGFTGSGGLTGSNTGISVAGRKKIATWEGSMGTLSIVQKTIQDTETVYFVVNVTLKNTGSTTLTDIYYNRTVDPDQDVFATVATNQTNNKIENVSSAANNRVLVTSIGASPTNIYLGLGTKDCRAKSYIYTASIAPSSSRALSTVYGMPSPYLSALGASNYADCAIGLIFKLADLDPGDSTTLSFAYVLKNEDLDSAFAQTEMSLSDGTSNFKSGDTISKCQGSKFNLSIVNPVSSSWAWTPKKGMSDTTGISKEVLVSDTLITYRAVNTSPSFSCSGSDTIYITVKPLSVPVAMVDTSSPVICAGQSVNITASAYTKGNALDFSGATNNYVSIPNKTPVSLAGSSNFTVSTWIYPRSNKRQNILFHGLGCASWANWTLGVGGPEGDITLWPKKIGFTFMTSNGGGLNSVGAADTIVPNQWMHVAVTYNGAALKLYINGVLNNTASASGTPWNSPEQLFIGGDPGCGGRQFYDGKLDELQIWNKVRSDAEIMGTYKSELPATTPNLTAYYRFDENNGANVYDLSDTANFGTIVGAVPREIPSTAPLPVKPSGTVTYAWTPITGLSSSTTAAVTASPTSTTMYTFRSTFSATGCSSINKVRVLVNPLPDTPASAKSVVYCQGTTPSPLVATGINLKWYTVPTGGSPLPGAPTPSTATVGSTKYYVSQTITSTGCEGPRTEITVTINATPLAPVVVTPVELCVGGPITTLSVTKGAATDTIRWYTASSGGTASTTPPTLSTATATSVIHYASLKTNLGCEGPRSAITVNVNAVPSAPTVTTPVVYCQGATATALTATGSNLKWYNVATGGTALAGAPTPSTATPGSTTYYVSQSTAATAGSCEGPRTSIVVTINPTPVAPVVVTPVEYCLNATAVPLSATKASSTDVLWWYTVATGGTGTTTAPTPLTSPTGSTVYYVSAKTALGCEGTLRGAITVNINPLPAAPTVPSSLINLCVGGPSSTLTATGTGLKWYTVASGGTGSSTAPTPSTAAAGSTDYYVSQTTPTTNCEGPRSLITVVVNALPAAPTVSTPVNLCLGGPSSPLTASGSSLLWYTAATGGTGSSTAPTPSTGSLTTTTWYVTQTSASSVGSCESFRSAIVVKVNALPSAPTVVTPLNICIGVPASPLSATGSGLKWYLAATGGTGSTTAPTPTSGGLGTTNFYVSQTSVEGCESSRATLAVTVQPSPVLSIAPVGVPDFVFCDLRTVTLKANSPTAVNYQWQTGGFPMAGETNDSVKAGTKAYYGVTVKNIYGCKTVDSVLVKDNTLPVPKLSPTDVQICEGVEIMLYASPASAGYTYDWIKDASPMAVGTTVTSTPIGTTGNYVVQVTDIYTCVKMTNPSIVTTFPTIPKPTILRTDPVLKLDKIYTKYQWYRNYLPIPGATLPTYNMSFDGTYYAQVFDMAGCFNYSDTVQVSALSIRKATINNAHIKIYPNPSKGIVNIDAPMKVDVIVNDVVGRQVIRQENAHSVDLSELADGTYFLRIFDEQNMLIGVEKINKMSANN